MAVAAKRADRLVLILIGAVAAGLLVLIYATAAPRVPGPSPENSGRLSATELAERRASEPLQIIDVRGQAAYEQGHVPGAVRIDPYELRDPVFEVLHYPPDVVDILTANGIVPDVPIVVYGDRIGPAAYVGWALVAMGHPSVYLLDGGISAWLEAGEPVESGPAQSQTADPAAWAVPDTWPQDHYMDLIDLYQSLSDSDLVVVDSRPASERASGEIARPDSQESYHIPWDALVTEDGTAFRNRMALHQLLQVLPARKHLVVYGADPFDSAVLWWALFESGYARVSHFEEPFDLWADMGFPVRQVGPALQAPTPRIGGGCG